MLTEQDIQNLIDKKPALRKILGENLEQALKNPNSLEYKARATLVTFINAQEQLNQEQLKLTVLKATIDDTKKQIQQILRQEEKLSAASKNANQYYQQQQEQVEKLVEQLKNAQKEYKSIQKELNKVIAEQEKIIAEKSQINQELWDIELDQKNLLKEKNPDLTDDQLNEALNTTKGLLGKTNLNSITEASKLNLTGADLLKAMGLGKKEIKLENKNQKLNDWQQELEATQSSLESRKNTLSETIINIGQELIQLGKSLKSDSKPQPHVTKSANAEAISSVNQDTLAKSTTPTPRFRPFTWITNFLKKKDKELEEEQSAQHKPASKGLS